MTTGHTLAELEAKLSDLENKVWRFFWGGGNLPPETWSKIQAARGKLQQEIEQAKRGAASGDKE